MDPEGLWNSGDAVGYLKESRQYEYVINPFLTQSIHVLYMASRDLNWGPSMGFVGSGVYEHNGMDYAGFQTQLSSSRLV